jgi:Mlc titration factor MtfA (ptsG expression regulator)
MEAVAIVAVVGAVLVLCLFAGWSLVRRWKPPASRAPSERAPEQWRALLEARVPLVRRLSPGEWDRLFELVQTFLREKHFEGGGGLEVTDEMKLIVATQACLLILHLDAGCYPGVRTVILYPSTFLRRSPVLDGRMYVGVIPHPEPLLGEHVRGAVVLAWDSSLHGASDTGDGQNVVLHEFAHELDREDGYVDGTPLLEAPSSTRTWARVLQQRFDELRRSAEDGVPDVLNAYGATNRAEFFAVATETFFGNPEELRRRYPDLYAELKGFYRQDPAGGTPTA